MASLSVPTHAAGISSYNVSDAEALAGMLNVFSGTPIDSIMEKGEIITLQPLHPYSKDQPLEFLLGK